MFYKIDDLTEVIDTFDDKYLYRVQYEAKKESLPIMDGLPERILHGFSRNPLVYHRGKVAGNILKSIIEIIELLTKYTCCDIKTVWYSGISLKREMNEDSFKRDNGTLVINLPADEGSGYKTEAKTLEFPEPESMIAIWNILTKFQSLHLSALSIQRISLILEAVATALHCLCNDIALATQSVADWSDSINEITYLFQEMLDWKKTRRMLIQI